MKMSWQIFWKLYSLFKNHMDDGQGSSRLTFLLTKRLISWFSAFSHENDPFHPEGSCMYMYVCEPPG